MPDALNWDDVGELHVIRRVRQMVARRFGLDLAFATSDGRAVAGSPAGGRVVALEIAIGESAKRVGAVRAGGDAERVARAGASTHADYLAELLQVAADEILTYLEGAARPTPAAKAHSAAKPFAPRYSYDAIVGKGRAMQDLYRVLDKVIGSDATVLVQGENGTGKELIAKAIHFYSRRAREPFVVQNCSAFNDNLLDSELFGHKKGSFTGAIAEKQGLFEVADGGTFFLDEIGDMSPAMQVKLLRVLQEGTFIPVGDTQPRHVDVRIIAATNRDLRRMVDEGEFREDLYYRINVISLTVPPLRDRRDDLPALVDHFLKAQAQGRRLRMKRLTRGCFERLQGYGWPGNVRELENEIERLVVLAGDEKVIGEEMLSPRIRQALAAEGRSPAAAGALPEAVRALERTMILDAMRRTDWNKTRAARELRISRRNLIRKVQKYRLVPEKRGVRQA